MKKNNKVILILILIIIILIALCGYMYFSISHKVNNNQEEKIVSEEQTTTSNKEINYLTDENLKSIENLFPNFDYYLENILENAGYEAVQIDSFHDYITNNLSNEDLLNDKKFKFALAFHLGKILYSNKYSETEATGCFQVSITDFEEIYKKLYSEDYSFVEIPSGTKFQLEDDKIIGAIYTSGLNVMYFDLIVNDTVFTANIYNYNRETSDKGETYYGLLNLIFEKDDNDLYAIKHLYLNK